ncbi:MAG: hypothetical protein EOP10_20100 [Proteobacteria bacterium]|nr:MAG: hypothetical protein EOP10_20100 [Pseudomonadota bacterium]
MAEQSRKEKEAGNGRKLGPLIREFFLATQFGAQLIACTLVFLGLVGYFGYAMFSEQYVQIQTIFKVVDDGLQHELIMNDIVRRNMTGLVVAITAYIVVMIVLIVRAHHKYTGPLVAVTRFVVSMTNGYYAARLNLRKKDEHLRDLEKALNVMAEELERRHSRP